jgi:hypothetical protein
MAKNKTLLDMAIHHLAVEGYGGEAQAICRLRDENVRLKDMVANGVDVQEITHQDYWKAQLKGKPTDFAQNLIDQLTNRIKMARSRPDE